ncbi:hypothetical protein Y032_0423g1197 [Ancylostoma ceylanicum]|uniref:Rootletin-like coiled-coil domain-containing protein n=1 Tax=Ancylostoma ceylanicum TaxID=53326 RepID=A0A016X0Y8_9BILA|nr:hypothetical protein Y032_0423g1197 [Ancylostoma ceylanicum]
MSSRHGSSEDVAKVTEELSYCRTRLDAGVQENRRNRDIIQGLTEQIQKFRKRTAQDSAHLVSPAPLASSLPQLTIEMASSPYIDYVEPSHSSPRFHSRTAYSHQSRNKSLTRLDQPGSSVALSSSIDVRHVYSPRFRSSPRLLHYSDEHLNVEEQQSIDELFSRLKSELFKNNTLEEINDMLREENDAALAANDNLRQDVVELTKALEHLEQSQRDDRDRFKTENSRYRSQVEQQHRQLIELWKAFTAVKRKVRELHTSTANDLDKQLTEFTRCAAMMKKAIRHAEFKNTELRDKMAKEKDEVLEEVMAKYEALSTSQIETEKQLMDKTRQLQKLQDELHRTKEQCEEVESSISRICNMTELSSAPVRLRTRSESPVTPHTANEAMRKIRAVLSTKAAQLREADTRVEQAELEMSRLKKQIEAYEKEKKTQKDRDKLREEEITEREAKLSTVEHELRRATERIQAIEEEKNMKETMLATLQNTITTTHRSHKEFIEGLMSNHRDELEARDKMHESELEERLSEERARLNRMQSEVDRLNTEVDNLREQLRNVKADYSAARKAVEEKDFLISTLEESVTRLKSDLEIEVSKLDTKENEITEHNLRYEEMSAKEQQLKQDLMEAQELNTVLSDDNKALQDQLIQLRSDVDKLQEQVDNTAHQEEDLKARLEESHQLNIAHEQHVHKLKSTVRVLEEKIESDVEEMRLVREQLGHHQNLTKERGNECTELLRQLEDVKRERDGLLDELAALRTEIAAVNSRLAQAEGDAERRRIEENEKRSLMEDLRVNFDRLTAEIKQKELQTDDLKEQIKLLQSASAEKEEFAKAEKVRLEEESELKRKEVEQLWSEKLRKVTIELEQREKVVKECENRLEQLTRLHEKLMEEEHSMTVENAELIEKLQETSLRHKKEMEDLIEQNNLDREEWENERQQLEKSKNALLNSLRADLAKAETEIKEALAREDALRAEVNEAKEEVKELLQRLEKEKSDKAEQQSRLRERDESKERNRLNFTAQLEESQVKLVKSAAQLEEANRKKQSLEGEITKLETALARKTTSMKELEQKIDGLMERLRASEIQEQKYRDQMAVLEKENIEMSSSRDKQAKKLAEEQKKTSELEQKLRELNKGMHTAQLQVRTEKEQKTERIDKVNVLTQKIRQLEIQLADRTAKSDINSDLVKKMETDTQTLVQELNRQKQSNAEIVRQNDELRATCKTLDEELTHVRTALEKKTSTSKQAMADLLNNYKESEKNSVERAAECEQLKAQLRSASAKVERLEKRRTELETRLEEGEARNSELMRKIHQYERSAKMALNMAGSQTPLRAGQSIVDITKATSSSGIGESISVLRTTSSTHDLSFRMSPERNVHFPDTDKPMDISSSMEITLRYLKERIEQLERDKAELTNDLMYHRDEMQKNVAKTNEAVNAMQSLERRVHDLQSENENLESRLATQRQLYVSNEETMRAKDLEHRGLKAKIMSAELHIREKDSKINQLMSQLEALRLELSQMGAEKQKLSSMAKGTEHEMRAIEHDSRRLQEERDQLARRLSELESEYKASRSKLNDVELELVQTKRHLEESRRQQRKDREHVEKLQSEERHWKQAAVSAKKSSEDYHKTIFEEKITHLQHNHDALVSKNDALAVEIDRLRSELRESNHRNNLLNQKLAESERNVEDAKQSRKTMTQQIVAFQKAESEWSKLEREMREELVMLRKERLVLTSEVEELKRKLVRVEVEKKELDGFRARLDREVASLKKHVEALEEEKSRTEIAVRNTLSERKAIDKSLAAMEKENTELYRNCAQLQSQIAQLERDTGNRNVTKMLKDQGELETRISKLTMEKRQVCFSCFTLHSNLFGC